MATIKSKLTKHSNALLYIIFAGLVVVAVAGYAVTQHYQLAGFAAKEPENAIEVPFAIYAWGGYEGWFNCASQDGGVEQAERFCRCHGYQNLAETKPCYESKSVNSYRIDTTKGAECDFIMAGAAMASGLGTTKISCGEVCAVPDDGKHTPSVKLTVPFKDMKLWGDTSAVYEIKNSANKDYNYRIELLTEGGVKRIGAPDAGIARYSYNLLSSGRTIQYLEHSEIKPGKVANGTLKLLYTDANKDRAMKTSFYVHNPALDCWAKLAEVETK